MKIQNKEVAIIKLYAPKGETMVWKTSIDHVYKDKVKYLNIAKRNFAHYLVNKYWLLAGKAYQKEVDDLKVVIPYGNRKELRKEVNALSKQIVAKRIYFVKKKGGQHE